MDESPDQIEVLDIMADDLIAFVMREDFKPKWHRSHGMTMTSVAASVDKGALSTSTLQSTGYYFEFFDEAKSEITYDVFASNLRIALTSFFGFAIADKEIPTAMRHFSRIEPVKRPEKGMEHAYRLIF